MRNEKASVSVSVPSDEKVDELLDKLDEMARRYDRYASGLPLYDDEELDQLREAVRSWLAGVKEGGK